MVNYIRSNVIHIAGVLRTVKPEPEPEPDPEPPDEGGDAP
jgi:hypothetical protein